MPRHVAQNKKIGPPEKFISSGQIFFLMSSIGIEPMTYRLGGSRSILLSYEDATIYYRLRIFFRQSSFDFKKSPLPQFHKEIN